MARRYSHYSRLRLSAENQYGGSNVFLEQDDDGRAFSVFAQDGLCIELEELPASGSRWHVVDAPPGFMIDFDGYLQDGTWFKNGNRRKKYLNAPATRRVILYVEFGAEEGRVVLQKAHQERVSYDEWGLAEIAPRDVEATWFVEIEDTETPLAEQRGLPGRAAGQPPFLEAALSREPRERLSALAG